MAEEIPTDPLARYEFFRNSPWMFLKHCVKTHDEVDSVNPIKSYPSHFTYLFFLVQMWMKFKKLAIPKSRRMTVSWTYIGLTVWDVIFHKGRSWAFTSKKEQDAAELVERAEFIFKHIPPDMISPDLLPKMKNGRMQSAPPAIIFPELYSSIEGFPQGADQLRQRGFSGIFEDECAFQEDSEATYAAAEPTIKGGGYMVKVSSRSIKDGGFFKRVCFDKINSADNRFPEIPPVPAKSPMEGITVWKNPDNEFLVIDLHYTANPAKRGDAFREGLKKTLPIRTYRMEYEKSWETFDGKPVYEDFNELIHVRQSRPEFHAGLPLLLGWDSSGLTPACVIAQLQEEQLVVFMELVGQGMGAKRFVPYVEEAIRLNFPQVHDFPEQIVSFFDPAGFRKNEITEETYIQRMALHGFRRVFPGPMTWNKRVDSVTERLTEFAKGQPKIMIYETGAPTLVAGFKGGFRYPDTIIDTEPDKPKAVKDIHSHPHDALQYLCGGLKGYRRQHYGAEAEIPVPSYGFQKTTTTKLKTPKVNNG